MAEETETTKVTKTSAKATKGDRLLELAKEHYERRRATRWPYLVCDGREFKFEGDDRKRLKAALGELWRKKFPAEGTPSDRDMNRVVDALRYLAEEAAADEPGNADVAAEIVTAGGVSETPTETYEVNGGCLTWNRPTKDGIVPVILATFDARITEEVTRDDGAEQTLTWGIRVIASDGRTGDVVITPELLGRPQQWATQAVGMSALVMPGLSVAEQVRVAVHSRSPLAPRRVVFAHTGWRSFGSHHGYLTSSGALGADGLDESVTVDLGTLDGYALPAVPDVRDVRAALAKSLAMLDAAPDKVTVPVLAAIYRAPLPLPPECAVWVYGRSGTYKTALTAVAQQHYGPTMDAHALPGNWTSTANALEAQAFTLDGALFTVDDYSPDTSTIDAQRRAAAADRLIRGAANRSGRGRLRPDGSMRPAKPPRAQVLTSAEDIPPGVESMRARTMVTEISPGDIDLGKLGTLQAAAGDGTLAVSVAAYVAWLAARYDADEALPRTLAAEQERLRDAARADGHPRYAINIGSLALGVAEFLAFAESVKAITAARRTALWKRAWAALVEAGAEQERYGVDAQPHQIYLRAIGALIASGRAHLADLNGRAPANAGRWGWAIDDSATIGYTARGERLGFVDGDDVYLHADVAYHAARKFAESSPSPLNPSKYAVHKMLQEKGLLASTAKGHLTTRKRADGGNPTVIHLTVKALDGE